MELVHDDDFDSKFFRKLEESNVKFNRNQIKAVRHINTPALVLSVAGSGKTQVLTSRLAYLMDVHNVSPEDILLLTYTNKAAKEMKDRVNKVFPHLKNKIENVTSGTFHSVCLGILRKNWDNREVWSSSKSQEITIKTILRSLDIEKNYEAEDIISLISHYKNNLIGLNDVPRKTYSEKEFYNIFQKYEEHKKKSNLMDFGDMIFDGYNYLKTTDKHKFKYILVDEGQDTNTLQFKLIDLLCEKNGNVFLVADDDQTIFSFSGAKSENVLNFNKIYPTAEIITLDTNYRCTDTILGLANHVISKNTVRHEKVSQSVKPSDTYPRFIRPLSNEEEATQIVREIKNAVTTGRKKYSDFAILHRTGANARAIFEHLLLEEVPFISFNSDEIFYENGTVKPLLSYLKLTYDPTSIKAIGDVLPTLYLGKDKLKHIEMKQKTNPIKNPIEHVLSSDIKPFQRSKVVDKINQLNRLSDSRPIITIRALKDDYEKYLVGEENETTTTLHREIIVETLNELENASKSFSTNKEFIEHVEKIIKIAKIQKEAQKKSKLDSVKLMTIHKSKGLEFDTVYLISLIDGVIPHKSSLEVCTDVIPSYDNFLPIEEENRLLYVGITRAKNELTLSIPQTYRGNVVNPSRFLEEFIDGVEDDELEEEYYSVFG